MTPQDRKFEPGMRVRYLLGSKDAGTVIRRKRRHPRFWCVRWDHDPHGPRLLDAHEDNMEILPDLPFPTRIGGA